MLICASTLANRDKAVNLSHCESLCCKYLLKHLCLNKCPHFVQLPEQNFGLKSKLMLCSTKVYMVFYLSLVHAHFLREN